MASILNHQSLTSTPRERHFIYYTTTGVIEHHQFGSILLANIVIVPSLPSRWKTSRYLQSLPLSLSRCCHRSDTLNRPEVDSAIVAVAVFGSRPWLSQQ
mmetsp:Transcript_10113/g.25319  ORF Transcript_10113/g.25319 Transcript_10113/m.25319 type:complete len:99 (-) Transcript_10113:2630-2926(-)